MRKALERAGAQVTVVTDRRSFAARTPGLLRTSLHEPVDAFLVGFPGHADVATARLAGTARRAPVIFDAFVSLYESAVGDRRTVARGSIKAFRYAVEDQLASALATRVVLDTDAHARYFAERFKVPPRKLRRIWVGADDEVMRPGASPVDSRFRVFMYASFIPLHGLEYVVEAAHLLEQRNEEVSFTVVGTGDCEPDIRRLARDLGVASMDFVGRRPYETLPALISAHHVCLGIFGTSGKASRVIPNKVFDALAVGRAVITADTPAVREALTHRRDVWLCAGGSADALAASIVALRDDAETRDAIADAGHALFTEKFSIDALSHDVSELVLETLDATGTNRRS